MLHIQGIQMFLNYKHKWYLNESQNLQLHNDWRCEYLVCQIRREKAKIYFIPGHSIGLAVHWGGLCHNHEYHVGVWLGPGNWTESTPLAEHSCPWFCAPGIYKYHSA